jgi:hypothetical protein
MRMLQSSYATWRMAFRWFVRLLADRLDGTEVSNPMRQHASAGKPTALWSLRARGIAGITAPFVALLAVLALSAAPALAAAPPTIEGESVSNVTEHEATLEARIDPEGLETTYEIWVAEQVECQADESCPIEFGEISQWPARRGQISAGDSNQVVSADLTHLEKESSYSFWVVATNSAGKTEGSHRKFHAELVAAFPPSEVVTEPAEATPTGFKLKGKLNPGGLPTTYYFEYIGQDEAECVEVENCWPETAHMGPLTGNIQQAVPPLEVTGLRSGETYRYRLVARNADGVVRGSKAKFTVDSPPLVGSSPFSGEPASSEETVESPNQPLSPTTSPPSGAGQPTGAGDQSVTSANNEQSTGSGGSSTSPSPTPGVGVIDTQAGKIAPKRAVAKCPKGKKLSHGKCVKGKATKRKGKGKQ